MSHSTLSGILLLAMFASDWSTSIVTASPAPQIGTGLSRTTGQPRSASPLDPTASGPKQLATNLKGFGVPFKINAQQNQFIEVQLYLSEDRGQTWSFYARQTTDQEEFPFEADADGEYWFALKTLNRDRRLLPEGDPQPELKILVDTVKPKLEFRVETDLAGRVICSWQASDPNLEPASLKIFYQPIRDDGALKPWLKVPVQLGGTVRNGAYSDQIGWWPETSESQVNVAVEIQDAAGNTTRVDRQVKLAQTAWKNRSIATARPAPTQTQRPSYANPQPAVEQPDWAKPNWKPAGGSQTNQDSPETAKQEQSPLPPNVVCENGVCRIAGDTTGMFGTEPKRFTPNPPAPKTAQQLAPNNAPPVRSAQAGGQPLQLVGSPPEYVDPPVPPGYVPKVAQRQSVGQPTSPQNDPSKSASGERWESRQVDTLPPPNITSSTTRRVDPTITPRPENQVPSSPTTFVPSNPATTRVEGDRVISESSTSSPRNQYRPRPTSDETLAAPTLLPNQQRVITEETGNHAATTGRSAGFPSTGQAGFIANPHGEFRRLPATEDADQTNPTPGTLESVPSVLNDDANRLADPVSPNPMLADKPLRETRAPVEIVGSQRFRLNYGIDSIDPSGVGRVDLWVTRDDGASWNNWGTDPDNQSPFPVEVKEQGRYGFRIVVQSQDGLSGQGPSSGDDADMWIVVDTESPLVRIQSVPYGRGEDVGRLVINYMASDKFLTLRPITLSYAESPQGPWNVIESGLRNEQRYVWKVAREVPDSIYLKIEAIDRAGNIGVHQLSRPIDVSGLVPSGTIHGVTPVGK